MNLYIHCLVIPRGRGKIEIFFLSVNKGLLQILDRYSVGGKPSSPPTLTMKEFESQLSEFIVDKYNHQAYVKDHYIKIEVAFVKIPTYSLLKLDKM